MKNMAHDVLIFSDKEVYFSIYAALSTKNYKAIQDY